MATKYDTWLTDVPYDAEGEWIAERAAELAQTEAIRREADEWLDGTFDGEHYTALEIAMADLHEVEPVEFTIARPTGSTPSTPYPVSMRIFLSLTATKMRTPLSSPFFPIPQAW